MSEHRQTPCGVHCGCGCNYGPPEPTQEARSPEPPRPKLRITPEIAASLAADANRPLGCGHDSCTYPTCVACNCSPIHAATCPEAEHRGEGEATHNACDGCGRNLGDRAYCLRCVKFRDGERATLQKRLDEMKRALRTMREASHEQCVAAHGYGHFEPGHELSCHYARQIIRAAAALSKSPRPHAPEKE